MNYSLPTDQAHKSNGSTRANDISLPDHNNIGYCQLEISNSCKTEVNKTRKVGICTKLEQPTRLYPYENVLFKNNKADRKV